MRSLLDFIAGPESSGRYDIAFGGATMPPGMTVGQVLDWQRQHAQRTGSSAAGRYQFLRKTLQGLVDEMGIDPSTPFTPELQDQLATQLLHRRGLGDFEAGKLSPEGFARNLAKEWAGLPSGPHGRSHYHGDKMNNRAGVSWDELLGAITGNTDTAPQVDARTASTEPMAGAPAVSPYTLPDTAGAPAMFEPDPNLLMNMDELERMRAQLSAPPDLNRALMAFGAGVLNARGGNWFGSGAKGVADLVNPSSTAQVRNLLTQAHLMELESDLRQESQRARWMATLPPEMRDLANAAEAGSVVAKAQLEAALRPPPAPTASQRDYEFLVSAGVDPQDAQDLAFGGGGVTVNMPGAGDPGAVEYGPVPSGFARTTDDAGAVTLEPLPGSPEAMKRAQAAQGYTAAKQAIEDMRQMVRTHGEGLSVTGEARATMSQLYADLVATAAQLGNSGVLQPGEVEEIKRRLPDPTDRFTLKDRDAILAAYDALEQRLDRRMGPGGDSPARPGVVATYDPTTGRMEPSQ